MEHNLLFCLGLFAVGEGREERRDNSSVFSGIWIYSNLPLAQTKTTSSNCWFHHLCNFILQWLFTWQYMLPKEYQVKCDALKLKIYEVAQNTTQYYSPLDDTLKTRWLHISVHHTTANMTNKWDYFLRKYNSDDKNLIKILIPWSIVSVLIYLSSFLLQA